SSTPRACNTVTVASAICNSSRCARHGDRALRTLLDSSLHDRMEPLGHLSDEHDRVAVVAEIEHVGAQAQAHAVTLAAVVVDVDAHQASAGSNSMYRCVKPRRMNVGT